MQENPLGEALCAAPFLRPGDGDFTPPTATARASFRNAMTALLRSPVVTQPLRNTFTNLGFTVTELTLHTERFTVIADSARCPAGRGVFVVREHPTLDAAVEVPHVGFEQATVPEGYALFIAGARALAIAGTHRCASHIETACRHGARGVCTGEPRGYRSSDAAAFTETFFHAMHEALSAALPHTVAISLHAKRARLGEPWVVTSNGTRSFERETALSRQVASRLSHAGVSAGACQDFGANYRLCGTSNVQARASNGARDACHDVPTVATETFLHIEQDASKITTVIARVLIEALRALLPISTVGR